MTHCSSAAKSRGRARPDVAFLTLAVLAVALLAACTQTPASEATPRDPEPWRARRELQEARSFWIQGRFEAAERATKRGLDADPGNAQLHRLRAEVLDELGKPERAAAHRERANALDPPPPPLPDGPHRLDAPGLQVVLLPPPALSAADRDRIPPRWPSGDVARTLHARLAVRLPRAEVLHADPQNVDQARSALGEAVQRVLTLRVERAFFATTAKDGAFGLARLSWSAASRSSTLAASSGREQQAIDSLVTDADPRLEAVARAFESLLEESALGRALDPGVEPSGAPRAWRDDPLATLFPAIASASTETQRRGRSLLARGELEAARDAFSDALRILPSDPRARELYEDTEAALAIARQLAASGTNDARRVELDPQLSPAEEARLEAQLRDARAQRDRLAASLEVLADTQTAPSQSSIDALSPGSSDEFPVPAGLTCGAEPSRVTARTLHGLAADGTSRPLARFYFYFLSDDYGEDDGEAPKPTPERLCLRADDRDEDGRMDAWTAYRGRLRSDRWEDRRGVGDSWDLHIEYEETGREPLRITFWDNGPDAPPSHRLLYVNGRPQVAWHDSNGDGRFDTFDQFDPDAEEEGVLTMRAEDRDGDGELDVRSFFQDGRLVRREWLRGTGEDARAPARGP